MTTEIEYVCPTALTAGNWQVQMAKQIESDGTLSIGDIEREINGGTLVVRLGKDLSQQAVKDAKSDIKSHLPSEATHVETREVK